MLVPQYLQFDFITEKGKIQNIAVFRKANVGALLIISG